MSHQPGRSTLAIHGPPHRGDDGAPAVTPVYQSSTFRMGPAGEVVYSRYGNNPNQIEVARRYAALEGAERAVFLSSGNAATALAHLAVLRPGDHLVASEWIYGGTRAIFDQEFLRQGIAVTYVSPDQPREWRRSIRKTTRAIFVEAVTIPLLRVVDLDAIAKVTRDRGLALLVDGTFASPINLRPLEHGADVVITSATKYLGGHSDVIAGAVAGSAPFIDEVTRLMRNWGSALDPHAAWLVERGMKTLPLRIERSNINAAKVAHWALTRREFRAVHWPGLDSHPDHAVASSMLDGFGGLVGLQLDGAARAARLCDRLEMIVHAPSLAGVESLISEPRLTSHAGLTPEQRAAIGIPDGFVRLSCGCEDAGDIIRDLEQALS